jgi:hypothetical protein
MAASRTRGHGAEETQMLLLDDGHGGVVVARARMWHRLLAHVCAERLNAELARGVSPDASIELTLRARALTSAFTRRGLAYGLRRSVLQASAGAGLASNRAAILAVTDQLEQLRRRLLGGGLVSPRGVAQIERLLTDGSGPLYSRCRPDALALVVAQALESIDVGNTASA